MSPAAGPVEPVPSPVVESVVRQQVLQALNTPSRYPKVLGRPISGFQHDVLGHQFGDLDLIDDRESTATVPNVGRVRMVEQVFHTTDHATTACMIRITYYECSSSEEAHRYYLDYVVPRYAGGLPPLNRSYGIGDCVLARSNLDKPADNVGFVVFYNNRAIVFRVSCADANSLVRASHVLERIERWAGK